MTKDAEQIKAAITERYTVANRNWLTLKSSPTATPEQRAYWMGISSELHAILHEMQSNEDRDNHPELFGRSRRR